MCRRCSECETLSHHWMDNSAFGDKPAPGQNTLVTHICKHCDACGNVCDDCGGDGIAFDVVGEPSGTTRQCLTCEGEGIVLVELKQSRQEVIADYIGTMIDDMLDEAHYWKMPSGETEPTWLEIRQAITEKLFSEEHEMGRQELNAEQVRDNCL